MYKKDKKKNFKSGFAAIIGMPNVGKSTLLNAIAGQKIAIISDKPQTTRNKIHGKRCKREYGRHGRADICC